LKARTLKIKQGGLREVRKKSDEKKRESKKSASLQRNSVLVNILLLFLSAKKKKKNRFAHNFDNFVVIHVFRGQAIGSHAWTSTRNIPSNYSSPDLDGTIRKSIPNIISNYPINPNGTFLTAFTNELWTLDNSFWKLCSKK
jgi:hypothetical protein